jgi:hypothetical protein
VREVLVERLDAHGAHAFRDQVADRIIGHGGDDGGAQAKTVGQVRRHVEFAAADVNAALGGLAKRNDARIQAVHQSAERNQVQRSLRAESSKD